MAWEHSLASAEAVFVQVRRSSMSVRIEAFIHLLVSPSGMVETPRLQAKSFCDRVERP